MTSNWISVYLFSDISFEQVIVSLIKKIIADLTDMNLIRSHFFIRYWDGGNHIRLRVLIRENKNLSEIKSFIFRNASAYYESQKDDQLYRIEFVPYEREIERYSGNNGVRLAESIFKYSSMTVINVISHHESKWNNGLAMAFAIKMHVIFAKTLIKESESIKTLFKRISGNYMMHSVKLDTDSQITQANTEKVKMAFEKTFLEQKEKIVSIVGNALCQEIEDRECESWEKHWLRWCKEVCVNLNKKRGVPSGQLIQFCENHIHMTNNRLGVHLRDESFIAFMIYNVFSEIKLCDNYKKL